MHFPLIFLLIHLATQRPVHAGVDEMQIQQHSKPLLFDFRCSKFFIYTVVDLAVFTDAYIYGLIIPVLPFALVERVHLHEDEVQRWIGFLLAAYGAGLIVGARKS